MNDELSAQLSSTYMLPAYAQGQIWVDTDAGAVRTDGPRGLFTLPAPAPDVLLRWGGADGPVLALLPWRADSLEWNGRVRVGGYMDAIHLTQFGDAALAVLTMGAQPLKPQGVPYLTERMRGQLPYPAPSFHDQLADSISETSVFWVLDAESTLYSLVHDALVSKLRVFAFGRLVDDKSGWHKLFALPLALESITLFAP